MLTLLRERRFARLRRRPELAGRRCLFPGHTDGHVGEDDRGSLRPYRSGQECRTHSSGASRMGADRYRAAGDCADRPRERGCGKGQSRPVEACGGAGTLIEPKGRMLRIELRCPARKAHPHPMRRRRSELGAIKQMDVHVRQIRFTLSDTFIAQGELWPGCKQFRSLPVRL